MSELTLKIDSFEINELDDYLLSLNGIKEVTITNENLVSVDVKYDEKLITEDIVKLEILAFIHALKWPSYYEFDRHFNGKTKLYMIERDSICCEFCYAEVLEQLYDIKEIKKVESNFYDKFFKNRHDSKKYYIKVYYDSNVLNEEKMKEIENELEIYG